MTAEPSDIKKEAYQHPIDRDIVESVAEEQEIDEFCLHKVLSEIQDFCEPNKDLVESVAGDLFIHSEMDIHPHHLEGSEDVILGGQDFTPSVVFARVDKAVIPPNVNSHVMEWGIAVEIAHQKQAEKFGKGRITRPLVIK